MKRNLLKSLLALALVSFGCMNVAAQEEDNDFPVLPVKMTYVDYYDADTSFGELETIWVGYTKAPTVGGTIASMKQGTDWNVCKVGYAIASCVEHGTKFSDICSFFRRN